MFERFWNFLSFNTTLILPINLSFRAILIVFIIAFIPAYIAYAKQGLSRRWIYLISSILFTFLFITIFIKIDAFFFNRNKVSAFIKTLYVIAILWSLFDTSKEGGAGIRNSSNKKTSFFKKWIGYPIEAFLFNFAFYLFYIIPLPVASAIGGFMGRMLGYVAKSKNKIANEGLAIAFPNNSKKENAKIRRGMWDMLGRYITEASHIKTFYKKRDKYLEIQGFKENVLSLKGKPFIACCIHSGSISIIDVPFAEKNIYINMIYRSPNNPLVEEITKKTFGQWLNNINLIPKGEAGNRELLKVLKKGESLSLMTDQRYNEGIELTFFGKKAMTAPGLAKFARHFDYPILPVQLIRENGAKHRLICHPTFKCANTDNQAQDIAECMQKVNDIIEGWIKENPEQWFWVHRRWGK